MKRSRSHGLVTVLGCLTLSLAVGRCGPLASSVSKTGFAGPAGESSNLTPFFSSSPARSSNASLDMTVPAKTMDQAGFDRLNNLWSEVSGVEMLRLTHDQVKTFRDQLKVDVIFPKGHFPSHTQLSIKLSDEAPALQAFEVTARPKGDGKTWTLSANIKSQVASLMVLEKYAQAMTLWYSTEELPEEPSGPTEQTQQQQQLKYNAASP